MQRRKMFVRVRKDIPSGVIVQAFLTFVSIACNCGDV